MINTDAALSLHQPYTTDLSSLVGYPLQVNLNPPMHSKPLFWESWRGNELLAASRFLETPGLSLPTLFPRELIESIPSEVRATAQSLPIFEFELMQAMLLAEEAAELAHSNRLLFVLLVAHAQKNHIDESEFLRLVKSKRTHILQVMGIEASNSLVKILARTEANFEYYSDVVAFTKVLRSPEKMQHLRHVKQLCVQHYDLLGLEPALVWPGLFEMVNAQSTFITSRQIVRLLRDSIQVGATTGQLRRLNTLAGLHALHDELVVRFNQFDRAQKVATYQRLHGAYPQPPLEGTEQIQPLTSWNDLLEEGQKLHHCVGSYHRLVASGKLFIYRVVGDERLTLSIGSTPHGWRLDELRGYCNALASHESNELVEEWLRERQQQ